MTIRVQLVASASRAPSDAQFATSYLVNDSVAIDAGSLGFMPDLDAQSRVRHVFLTHTHADHVASLPVFLENVFATAGECVTVWGSAAVLSSLRSDVFNDRVWPDLERLSSEGSRHVELRELRAGQDVEVEGLRLTPVPMSHTVSTFGFVLQSGGAAVVLASDTGPTQRLWEVANRLPALAAVFLEASFPDALGELAAVSRHLTPATFQGEVRKLHAATRLIAVHIKPRYREQVVRELQALGLPGLEIGVVGRDYEF